MSRLIKWGKVIGLVVSILAIEKGTLGAKETLLRSPAVKANRSPSKNKYSSPLQEPSTVSWPQNELAKVLEKSAMRNAYGDRESQTLSWGEIYQATQDAVVPIFACTYEPNIMEPFKSPERSMQGGSGFFITGDGYLVTNFHVVNGAVLIYIQLRQLGMERFELEFVGGCPEKDIALLKLTDRAFARVTALLGKKVLPFVELGDSDSIVGAQKMMVLGYPTSFGELNKQQPNISIGICARRETLHIGECIQTNAPINPGNSGGPVFDRSGKVIGVAVLKITAPNVENTAYLIPINDVKVFLPELMTTKILRFPFWGIALLPTTEETCRYLSTPEDGGLLSVKVKKGSLFERAGMQAGDVLYEVGGIKVDRYGFLADSWHNSKITVGDYLGRLPYKTTFECTIYRKGHQKTLTVEVEQRAPFAIDKFYYPFEPLIDYEMVGGLVVTPLTQNFIEIIEEVSTKLPGLIDENHVLKYRENDKRHEPRLVVSSVLPESQAYEARCFKGGDCVLQEVNGIPVHTLEEFRNAVKAAADKEFLTVRAEGGTFTALSIKKILEDDPKLCVREGCRHSSLLDSLANE